MTSTTQHIGAAGELLVQYRLLKFGIDSARLTTDSGIDLVAYAPGSSTAVTIQVKSAWADGAAGGKGKPAVGWSFPHDCKAQLLAFVKLSTDSVWLMGSDVGYVDSGFSSRRECDGAYINNFKLHWGKSP